MNVTSSGYCSCSLLMCGMLTRQGPHQVAQNSTTYTLSAAKAVTGSPLNHCPMASDGAGSPTFSVMAGGCVSSDSTVSSAAASASAPASEGGVTFAAGCKGVMGTVSTWGVVAGVDFAASAGFSAVVEEDGLQPRANPTAAARNTAQAARQFKRNMATTPASDG